MSRNIPVQPSWAHEGRRADRIDVCVQATIREHGSTKFDVVVSDISVTGFRFETIFSLREGSRIWISLPHLAPLESVIQWRREPLYGASFAHPLHPAVRDHVVHHYGGKQV
ncbi:MAG: PilZ domain-containing protein [Sphingomonadaceae bacterium]